MQLYLAGVPYDCEGFKCAVWKSGAQNLLFSYAHEPKHKNAWTFSTQCDQDMILYLAGSLSPTQLEKLALKAGAKDFLETFAHKDARECAKHLGSKFSDMRLFIDSGAFTAWAKGTTIDIDEYIKFCKEMLAVSKCKLTFAALDVIAGEKGQTEKLTAAQLERSCEQGWENYQYMKKQGVPCLMTFHQFERKYWLKRIIEDGGNDPYIGLSPRKVGVSTEEKRAWLKRVFRYIRSIAPDKEQPVVKTHGLGVSSPAFMEEFPFYSVDSTAWLQGGRSGAYRYFTGMRAPLIPPSEWKQNLNICIPAIDRYRGPGEADPEANVGIYFFAMRCMMRDVQLQEYITRRWAQRGVVWE